MFYVYSNIHLKKCNISFQKQVQKNRIIHNNKTVNNSISTIRTESIYPIHIRPIDTPAADEYFQLNLL